VVAINVYRVSKVWIDTRNSSRSVICDPGAVCRSISNGDQHFGMKLDDQC